MLSENIEYQPKINGTIVNTVAKIHKIAPIFNIFDLE
jgi:hypothetical protein